MLISGSFWITLQQGQMHFAKYFDSSAFGIMRAQLISTAHNSGDYLGRNNYAKVLLNILRAQRSLINEKILCLEINGIGRRRHMAPFIPPNAVANLMTADTSQNDRTSGAAAGSLTPRTCVEKRQCLVCKGSHTTLWSCPKLTSFLPEKNGSILKLPAAMCKGCLWPRRPMPNPCHSKDAWFLCKKTGNNKFVCDCAIHAPFRAWLLKSFKPGRGFKNIRALCRDMGISANRIVVPKINIGAMKLNDCFIGSSHCPSEIISM